MKTLAAVSGTLVLLAVVFFLWLFSGGYNVAATKPHTGVGEWALNTIMERSVRERAKDVSVPRLGDSAQLTMGFQHFEAMCVTCHGAPGVERSELGKGLLPEPPALAEAVPEWTSAELFWITKHGIKMSGMPAWGETHDDQALWAIVAFLHRLPEISLGEYEALRRRSSGGAHGHGSAAPGEHGHQHGSEPEGEGHTHGGDDRAHGH